MSTAAKTIFVSGRIFTTWVLLGFVRSGQPHPKCKVSDKVGIRFERLVHHDADGFFTAKLWKNQVNGRMQQEQKSDGAD